MKMTRDEIEFLISQYIDGTANGVGSCSPSGRSVWRRIPMRAIVARRNINSGWTRS